MSKLFLVTGGGGFIGSTVVRQLLSRGERVRVLDNFSTGRRENLTEVAEAIDLRTGSILDPDILKAAMSEVDYVIHLAAQVSVPASMDDPMETHTINATGSLKVFEAARAVGVKRVVYAATCAIYGNDPSLPKRETMKIDPQSPYAVSKYAGEVYGACYSECMGLDVVPLRFFNVFGPRQDPSGGYAAVIPVFATMMLRGQTPTIFGDGEQTRDFVHVDNVAAAIINASQAEAAAGRAYNIGTGVQTSLNQLVLGLNAVLGTDVTPTYGPARIGDVKHSVADITLAREHLNYNPAVDLEQGLAQTVHWYRQNEGL